MTHPAYIASNRFGMGARPGDLVEIQQGPYAWVEKQVTTPPRMPPALLNMKTTPELAQEYAQFQMVGKQAKKDNDKTDLKKARRKLQQDYQKEIHARTMAAVTTEVPLHERLVRFWANHFTVSASKNSIRPFIGAFEREVIRPHILGTFENMLLSATAHPAMLMYLDNNKSIGPKSQFGRKKRKGLNENLAREILELHTLGVDGGYSQDDVMNFAKVLTGWTIAPPKRMPKKIGQFMFINRLHEPGTHTILGKKYAQKGIKQGIAVLQDLVRHPSTARFIATKLARHFISDNPSKQSIEALTKAYLESNGHLGNIMRTLIDLPEAWQSHPGNAKTSEEYIISALRGFRVDKFSPKQTVASFFDLGHRVFEAPSPAGWPAEDQHWVGPDMILKRIEWAQLLTGQNRLRRPPLDVATALLGEGLGPETRRALQRADSNHQALTLLLASPEFQRR